MKIITKLGLAAASLAAVAGAGAADNARSQYQPLTFLIGHCWKGTFPNSTVTDEVARKGGRAFLHFFVVISREIWILKLAAPSQFALRLRLDSIHES